MLFPFTHKNNSKSFAILSIDSGSITLTVLSKSEKGLVHISYVRKVSLESDNVTVPTDLLRLIKSSLDKIFKEALQHNIFSIIKHTTEVIVLVGSPWHIGWNDKVDIVKDSAFSVTHKLIDESIRESFAKAHSDLSITNVSAMNYRLNGYVMSNPIGKITKSLELKVHISSAPTIFINEINNKVKSVLPHNKISFISQNSAVEMAISSMSSESNYIIIIPESKTTEVILVKNRVIQSEASIPFGSEILANDLFGSQSSGIKESLSKAKRFIDGDLDTPDLEKIGQVLEKIKSNFLTEFRDVLWKINNTLLLPNVIFVVGKNIASHFVMDWVNKETYSSETYTVDGFKIINIRGNDLVNLGMSHNTKNKKKVPLSVAVSYKIVDNINE
jgi:hypothetical protein